MPATGTRNSLRCMKSFQDGDTVQVKRVGQAENAKPHAQEKQEQDSLDREHQDAAEAPTAAELALVVFDAVQVCDDVAVLPIGQGSGKGWRLSHHNNVPSRRADAASRFFSSIKSPTHT